MLGARERQWTEVALTPRWWTSARHRTDPRILGAFVAALEAAMLRMRISEHRITHSAADVSAWLSRPLTVDEMRALFAAVDDLAGVLQTRPVDDPPPPPAPATDAGNGAAPQAADAELTGNVEVQS